MNTLKNTLLAISLVALIPIGLSFYSCSEKPQAATISKNVKTDSIIHAEIIFCGDVMQHMPQITASWDDSLKTYNYAPCFRYIKPFISSADFAIANFETTLDGQPYSGYPQFSCPDNLAYELKKTGYDLLLTANNHCCDRGKSGLERTLRVMDSAKMDHIGTYKDSADYKENSVQIKDIKGIKIAFINYTYSTNGIPPSKPNTVSFIDTTQIRSEIYRARLQKPDMVVATFHWGVEYERTQHGTQSQVAAFCFDHGVNLIFGSHPHVVQPALEFAEDTNARKVVFYSVGNFVSNQRDRYKNGGIMAVAHITKNINSGKTNIESWGYIPVWVYKQAYPMKYEIIPIWNFLQDTTLMKKFPYAEKENMKLFYSDTKELMGEKHEIQKKVSFE